MIDGQRIAIGIDDLAIAEPALELRGAYLLVASGVLYRRFILASCCSRVSGSIALRFASCIAASNSGRIDSERVFPVGEDFWIDIGFECCVKVIPNFSC